MLVKVKGLSDPIEVDVKYAVVNLVSKVMLLTSSPLVAEDARQKYVYADPMVYEVEEVLSGE